MTGPPDADLDLFRGQLDSWHIGDLTNSILPIIICASAPYYW